MAETLFVVIMIHDHSNEFGHTIGKIRAKNAQQAMSKSEIWLARKKKEHRCKSYSNKCYAYVEIPNRSLRTMGIDIGAEEIELCISTSK